MSPDSANAVPTSIRKSRDWRSSSFITATFIKRGNAARNYAFLLLKPLKELARSSPSEVMSRYSISA